MLESFNKNKQVTVFFLSQYLDTHSCAITNPCENHIRAVITVKPCLRKERRGTYESIKFFCNNLRVLMFDFHISTFAQMLFRVKITLKNIFLVQKIPFYSLYFYSFIQFLRKYTFKYIKTMQKRQIKGKNIIFCLSKSSSEFGSKSFLTKI